MNDASAKIENAAPPAPPAEMIAEVVAEIVPAPAPPPPPLSVSSEADEPTYTDIIEALPPGASAVLRTTWQTARRLVEFQIAPGFMVERIYIGQTVYGNYRECFGRRIEKDVVVAVHVLNPQSYSHPCKGIWYTSNVTQRDVQKDAEAMRPPPPPPPAAQQTVHNAGAPQGPATGVATTAHAPAAPVMVNGIPHIKEGDPVPQLQPGGQVVIQTGGYSQAHSPPLQAAQVHQPPQPYLQQAVGGTVGGQQIIHQGGSNVPAGGLPPHDPTKLAILMTRERCSKIAFVLRGGMIMPQEQPAIVYAFEQAVSMAAQHAARQPTPGANEVLVYLSQSQADRILGMIKGTDWQEIQGLLYTFQALAQGG